MIERMLTIPARTTYEQEVAVHKLLDGTEGCLMQLLAAIQEPKTFAKLSVECCGVIPYHVKAAAFCGPSGPNVLTITCPPWLYCVQDLGDVRNEPSNLLGC